MDDSFLDAHLCCIHVIPQEYVEIFEYLQYNKFPTKFNDKQKHRLIFKAMPYNIIVDMLYKKGNDGVLGHCITSSKIPLILKEYHDNMVGGHFSRDANVRKIL